MKKTLSLALALVMTVSLFTFTLPGAGAAFTDAKDITYAEAVDVIYALNIMSGYSDGTFRPTGLLTRGAAAKIICNMMLTPSIAGTMSNSAASKFKDVPAGHTFAGYISWCVQQGIVSGYQDNTFKPGDPLTTQAFLKMLLVALGYDATIEHYTGSGWSNNVMTRALSIGLNNGLKGTLTGSAQVNRQDACLFAFNTLQSNLVEYSGTRNTLSDKTSSTRNKAATIVDEGAAPYAIQFAENYYPDLKRVANTTDAFGCPATKWTLKNTDVGSYSAAEGMVTYYNEDVTAAKVYSDLGLTVKAPLTFYVNGADVTKANAVIDRNDTTKISQFINPAAPQEIGNGVEVRAFRTTRNDAPAVILSAIVYYPGVIASVQSSTSDRGRRVTVNGVDDARTPANFLYYNTYETNDFEPGDIIAYTFSNMPDHEGIQQIIQLAPMRGSVNRVVSGVSLDVSNVTYQNALNIVYGSAAGQETDLVVGNTYTVYLLELNKKEMALWVENVQATSDSYAWVKDISKGRQNFDYAKANLVFANGTEQIVSLNVYETYGSANTPVENLVGQIVTYSADSSDRYALTPVVTNAVAPVSVQNRAMTGLDDVGIIVDNSATFIVQDTVAKNYRVYNGMRSMPNVKNGAAYIYAEDGAAVVVFINNATITTTQTDLVFVAANSVSSPIRNKDNTTRTFKAVVNGQITTITVLVDSVLGNDGENPRSGAQLVVGNNSDKFAPNMSVILDSVEYNADELIIGGAYTSSSVTVGRAQGLGAPSNGSVRLGTFNGAKGVLMDLSNAVNVYNVSTAGVITKIGVNSVKADSDDWVYYTQDNKDITNLFILKVD